jgi:hypothetical protein
MDATSMQWQALISFLTPLLIQLAKLSQSKLLAWIDQNKPKVCVAASFLTALCTSMGIHFVHTPGALTMSWPSGATMANGFLQFIFAFGAQHVYYEGLWRHVVPTPAIPAPPKA